MEKLKSYITAIVAVAMIIGFSAFKAIEKVTMTEVWFTFDSELNPSDGEDYEDAIIEPSNYTNTDSPSNPTGCNTNEKVCAVRATPDGEEMPLATLLALQEELLDNNSNHPDISRKAED